MTIQLRVDNSKGETGGSQNMMQMKQLLYVCFLRGVNSASGSSEKHFRPFFVRNEGKGRKRERSGQKNVQPFFVDS